MLGWNGIFVGLAETMQVTETLSDGLKRNYTVVLPVADLESRRTERLTTLGKTLRLPGFRPGKVPMPIVSSATEPPCQRKCWSSRFLKLLKRCSASVAC